MLCEVAIVVTCVFTPTKSGKCARGFQLLRTQVVKPTQHFFVFIIMASGVSAINVLFHIGFRARKLGGTRRLATNRSVKGCWTCRVTLAFGTSAHRLKFYAFLSVLFMFSSIGMMLSCCNTLTNSNSTGYDT